jgi:hypothetical protein
MPRRSKSLQYLSLPLEAEACGPVAWVATLRPDTRKMPSCRWWSHTKVLHKVMPKEASTELRKRLLFLQW